MQLYWDWYTDIKLTEKEGKFLSLVASLGPAKLMPLAMSDYDDWTNWNGSKYLGYVF